MLKILSPELHPLLEHAHMIVVKNGGCNTSHSERVEQAFYTKYTGK
jgi:hypothetical protein